MRKKPSGVATAGGGAGAAPVESDETGSTTVVVDQHLVKGDYTTGVDQTTLKGSGGGVDGVPAVVQDGETSPKIIKTSTTTRKKKTAV